MLVSKSHHTKMSHNNHSSDDEENFEEPVPLSQNILKHLPGVVATDSMGYRIEALRVYLETQLGDIPFIAAYKHLVVSHKRIFTYISYRISQWMMTRKTTS